MKDVSVLIAGGGPVGLTLARDLAARGISCMLVERNATTTRHPKMDNTNVRSNQDGDVASSPNGRLWHVPDQPAPAG